MKSTAPKTARDIEKLIRKHSAEWPEDLKKRAHNALLSLRVMDRPDNRHENVQKLHKADLEAFALAYAEWKQ